METVIEKVVRWGVDNDASKTSCESLLAQFGETSSGYINLGMAILENAAVVDDLKLLVQVCEFAFCRSNLR